MVLARQRLGDVDGDLILGRHGLSAIGTLVERVSRYMQLVHASEQRRGEDVAVPLANALSDLPSIARRTLTWIRGSKCLAMAYSLTSSTKACALPIPAARGSAAPTKVG